MLRRDLSVRARRLAQTQNLLHDESSGNEPVVLFGHDDEGRHGNFHPASYAAIRANPAWARRLTKPHTASRRSVARKDWRWMELDSSNSSDALLMNIFCHPEVFDGTSLAPAVANLLNVEPTAQPCFGINPGVPLKTIRATRRAIKRSAQAIEPTPAAPLSDSEPWTLESPPIPIDQTLTDRTEIDLQLGTLFLEAKLTESNFQTAAPRLIERYRDLETVFDVTHLPRKILHTPAHHPAAEDYSQVEEPATISSPSNPPINVTRNLINGYQLIRNTLAAYAADAAFCVLCDARRHDLIETWYSVLAAVHRPTFAARLKLLTWQELSAVLPPDLQEFLDNKYGINPLRLAAYGTE